MTIHERVAAARGRLVAAGLQAAEADRDARFLARFLLEWDAARFWTNAADAEPAGFTADYERLVARRATREPVAYITGRKEFWGLSLEVTPAVLIPRPESELIVEAVLECLPDRHVALDVADVGTGSGCLAIALARELPHAAVTAIDISADALEIARRNATRHDVASRIEFRQGDLFTGLEREFHIIVSNPPYVAERDKPGLQPEVRDYEPAVALFASDSGRLVIQQLLDQTAAHLKTGGLLLFEFGFGQDDVVGEMIARTPGLALRVLREDLQGIPRTAIVQCEKNP